MSSFLHHILLAIATFAVTNIDDIIILSFYFAHASFKHSAIVIGQYIGIIALVVISLSGIVLGQIIDPHWIKWLGLFPIFLGVKALYLLWKNRHQKDEAPQDPSSEKKSKIQFLNVALITFANGGDNIGVYTPVFATLDRSYIPLYLLIFMILVGVWCFIAYKIGKNAVVKKYISKFGHIVLPVFLIFLGLYIIQ